LLKAVLKTRSTDIIHMVITTTFILIELTKINPINLAHVLYSLFPLQTKKNIIKNYGWQHKSLKYLTAKVTVKQLNNYLTVRIFTVHKPDNKQQTIYYKQCNS